MTSGPKTVVWSITLGILLTIAVVLRFLAKYEVKSKFSIDDCWIIVGLVASWAATGVGIWAVFVAGGGLDMRNIAKGNYSSFKMFLQVGSGKIQRRTMTGLMDTIVCDHDGMFFLDINNGRETFYFVLLPSDFFNSSFIQTLYCLSGSDYRLLVDHSRDLDHSMVQAVKKILGSVGARPLHAL